MSAEEVEKTRVLHGRPPVAVPAGVGEGAGKVVFHCPNGHRIVANAALAGKRGRCTKCQIDVMIPLPESKPSAGSGVGGVVLPEEPRGSEGSESAATVESGQAFPEIRIGSPPPLPTSGHVEEAVIEPPAGLPATWDLGNAPSEPPVGRGFEPTWPAAGFGMGPTLGDSNPTAQLVARLWAEREHGGIIELHLEGGSVILPDWYDANWSRGTHGLFASQAADGSVTLTAVAWETVRKVVVRQLTEVPDDMFT